MKTTGAQRFYQKFGFGTTRFEPIEIDFRQPDKSIITMVADMVCISGKEPDKIRVVFSGFKKGSNCNFGMYRAISSIVGKSDKVLERIVKIN